MAKSKNTQPTRRPDDVEVNSRRPKMKLRSPSSRRPSKKLMKTPPPKPPKDVVYAQSPELSSPPSLPERAINSLHAMGLEVRQTEQSKAILHAMADESRRVKKLDAICTPPLPTTKATPPRKKITYPPQVRHTPQRKAKTSRQNPPSQSQAESEPPVIDPARRKNAAATAAQNPPEDPPAIPVKRKNTTSIQNRPPEKQRKTTSTTNSHAHGTTAQPQAIINNPPPPETHRKTTTTTNNHTPHPTSAQPQAIINNPPPHTQKENSFAPRRSPRSLQKSPHCRPNSQSNNPHPPPPPPPPATISQPPEPTPVHVSEHPAAPDFEPMLSFNYSSSDDDDDEENLANIPSIRCKSSGFVETEDSFGGKRKVRGVVNGSTVASYKQTHNKGNPIKVEFFPDGTGPAIQAVGSLLVHEIGSAVRDKVPMLASSFRKLEEHHRRVVYDHLRPNFVIELKDDQLWHFIYKKAAGRYRDWKSECKTFYTAHGPDVTPREFVHRADQWEWLKGHFSDTRNQEKGKTMSGVRNKDDRMNHRGGKCPFYMRAATLAAQGEHAHYIATYSQVYSADPAGAALAAKMQDRVRQVLQGQNGDESEYSVLDDHEPIPIATQLDIITEVLGQQHGTYVSGTGTAFRRPPFPRGGARNSGLKVQLEKQKDEFLEMKAAFEERIRVLEDLVVRGGSANLASQNASEGTTSYGPAQ